jgi:hypothetical protein
MTANGVHCFNLIREEDMTKRVEGKIAVVVGAGQTPGETIGNGTAIAGLLAR